MSPRSFSRSLLLGACLLGTLTLSPAAHARRNFQAPYYSPAEQIRWGERNREFGRLWLSRFDNPDETARKILPFALEKVDGNADLRERAVIALGRIESPVALEPLENLLRHPEELRQRPIPYSVPENEISLLSLKFAVARIQSCDMKGTERLNFIGRAIDYRWPAVRMAGRGWKADLNSQKRGGRSSYDYEGGTGSPRQVIEEFAQLLHDMGQRGEDIQSLDADDLLVWPDNTKMANAAQSVILTAHMTRDEAIKFWLARALPLQNDEIHRTGSLSPQAFLDLGAPAIEALKVALKDLLERAKRDPLVVDGMRAVGPRTLFEAAAASGDADFIPILQGFADPNTGWTVFGAKKAIDDLKSGEGATILPRPKLYFGLVE